MPIIARFYYYKESGCKIQDVCGHHTSTLFHVDVFVGLSSGLWHIKGT